MNKLRTLLTWGLLATVTHVMGYTITVDPIQIQAGQSTYLVINLNNTETNLTAYQMFLYLPEGVTVQKKANGKYAYTANANRQDPDLFSTSVKDAADGSILIAVFSQDKDVIAGTSGELIRLPIEVASTVTTSLQGNIKNIEFTDVNSQKHNVSDINFTLTLQGSGTPNPGNDEVIVSVPDVTITAGSSAEIIVNMESSMTNLTAYQMSLHLPEGVTVQKKANGKYAYTSNTDRLDPDLFTVTVKDAADGSILIAVFSPDKDMIAGTSGELIRLPIEVASTVTTSLQGSIKNIEFTDVNSQKHNVSDITFNLTYSQSGGDDSPIITFADANVKALCVANWDTNDDGELSEEEAAAVSDLSYVFKENTTITSFNELQYFTGLTGISNYAFNKCTNLAAVTLPSTITSIGMCAFDDCYALAAINIPSCVTFIDGAAFSDCRNLTSIILPEGITSIGYWLLDGCIGLTEITIPESVTSIGNWAFARCSGLTHITIPNNVTSIGCKAFDGCSNLTSVTMPASVITFDGNEGNAFGQNNNIEAVYISDLTAWLNTSFPMANNPLRCGARLYLNNVEVKDLVIPDGTTAILSAAFEGCESLTSVTIPNSVTNIDGWAFASCSNLTTVNIAESVTSIGDCVFKSCYSLTDVWCYAVNIPGTADEVFTNTPIGDATLHVPSASLQAYSTTAPWSGFGNIVAIDDGEEPTQNNAIACANITARSGQQVELPIMLTNEADLTIVGISFTLTLPEGVTVAKDEYDDPLYSLESTRLNPKRFSVYTSQYADGSWGFRISTNNTTAVLNGTEGVFMTLTLDIPDGMEAGDYNVSLTENKLSVRNSDNSIVSKVISDSVSKLTINNVIMGDVNDDGEVDLSDAIMVTYYSLHMVPANFIEAAADMNGDGEIDLSDAITIIYRSLGVQ